MIGETVASNMQKMGTAQHQLQVSSTVGRNMADQLRNEGVIPNLNNMSAILPTGNLAQSSALANPYDINSQQTNQQLFQSFVRGNLT